MTAADMTPKRIQLSRKAGWRKPPDAIVVARPARWGNPFRVNELEALLEYYHVSHYGDAPSRRRLRDEARRMAVSWFADMLTTRIPRQAWPDAAYRYPSGRDIRVTLRGRDLACWCPLDQPCHADVLLEAANR